MVKSSMTQTLSVDGIDIINGDAVERYSGHLTWLDCLRLNSWNVVVPSAFNTYLEVSTDSVTGSSSSTTCAAFLKMCRRHHCDHLCCDSSEEHASVILVCGANRCQNTVFRGFSIITLN